MKKLFAGLLCSAVLLTSAPVFAAAGYTVEVEGKTLELGALAPYEESAHVMLPLRAVAEALGFTVTWDQGTKTALLDDGQMRSGVTVGVDSYYMAASGDAAAAPQSFGAVPALVEGATFVPSELFTLLCGQTTVADGLVSIRMETTAQIPNPMVQATDLAAASEALGFHAAAPEKLPQGYALSAVYVVGGTLLDLRYHGAEGELVFRMAKGSGDVSGDYSEYADVLRQPAADTEYTLKGSGGTYRLVLWSSGSYAYALSFAQPVSADAAIAVAESVKGAKE